MSRGALLLDVDQASKALREAQISLSLAVQLAYPVGVEVIAKIGGSKVTVKVGSYGSNWASPGDVCGVNVKTGKNRRFHYTSILGLAGDA
ncbi:hypothetical protein ACEN2T_18020 [Pseudomonas sp. W22_MBD1_FP4]|uniref:hypothetical protein n=1 Tax=Pseudomonas sp. W22_MBD1_FP4 TaxID=3240272 RepID=UPI003F96D68F